MTRMGSRGAAYNFVKDSEDQHCPAYVYITVATRLSSSVAAGRTAQLEASSVSQKDMILDATALEFRQAHEARFFSVASCTSKAWLAAIQFVTLLVCTELSKGPAQKAVQVHIILPLRQEITKVACCRQVDKDRSFCNNNLWHGLSIVFSS